MSLLATALVLLLLLVVSYSQRGTWIALGSAALSVALVAGLVVLSAGQNPSPLRQGLARLAQELPAGWDRRALDLAAAIEQASASLAEARKRAAQHTREPVLAASITRWFDWASDSEVETAAEPAPGPEPKPEAAPGSAVEWHLDAPSPTGASETFTLTGANISDQPFEAVRAVLKPDSGETELTLAVEVEGRNGGAGAVVPPGARFTLAAASLTKEKAGEFGGAILSFAYVQAGRRKSSILYLTPPMLAQGAASN